MTGGALDRENGDQATRIINRAVIYLRFSKLRLLGFKSFVDPTELVISDGLTGVVGPNGCGKSNLLEALRWVMGENRASAMRGSGMEDVIFNGASTRPARNHAEVTLVLDNSERLAPPAFNQNDQIDVIRRIVRDAGSAYKVCGKDARARDVQMLFADASTGAHSPALVRQGQISELVNAKPKARRRVLEEAAGISGLYQRRHEAELKLKGTETNLARVEDVLEQLASQLGSLARQAKQAARYREIADELRQSEGALLYRRWAEAHQTSQLAKSELQAAITAAASAEAEAARKSRHRDEVAESVPPLREEEVIAAAVLQRLIVERDAIDDEAARAHQAIEALTARHAQLVTDKDREASLGSDADEVIKELDWESEALRKASVGHEEREATATAAVTDAEAELRENETTLDRATEDLARMEARHQALERRFEEAVAQDEKAQADVEAATSAVSLADEKLAEAQSRLDEASKETTATASAAALAETNLSDCEAARAAAQAQEAELRARLSSFEGEAKALRAEAQALERILERDSGTEVQILDAVSVASGFEAALGAALQDDLKAPELSETSKTGWARLEAYTSPFDLPAGATPLREHVTAPAVLDRRLQSIGLVDRSEGDRLQPMLSPGQRLVSVEGDLWRWDGYRSNADETPTATALVLQQRNKLAEIHASLTTIEADLKHAQADHGAAAEALQESNVSEREAREARKAADSAATEAMRVLGRAEADANMLTGQLETHRHMLGRRREEAKSISEIRKAAEDDLGEIGDLTEARDALEGNKIAVASSRAAMLEARGVVDDLRREEQSRVKRTQEITKEVSGWKLRQDTAAKRLAELDERIAETRDTLAAAKVIPEQVQDRKDKLAGSIDDAEERRKKAADALAEGETLLRAAEDAARTTERTASETREARARAEAVAEAGEAQSKAAEDRIQEEMETTPDGLLEQLTLDPESLPSAEKVELDVARLKRQRDALGAVNLRAEEDAREVQEEHDTLEAEKLDLEAAVAELKKGIDSLNTEGRQRLLDAFDQVNKNFSDLFKHLFGGGEASLVLVESDDPLEAGLEIMCQPPGKKLSTLSLLSGGEQTLTAMSLIFAVFMANPSPICVLDEVDAPLDDANVTRFCDLLDEMTLRTDTRFLIITHHPVTMARMNRLFGVTMAEQGVSQLVSVDLQEAERIVA